MVSGISKKCDRHVVCAWLCLTGFLFVYASASCVIFHASGVFNFSFSFFRTASIGDAYFKSAAYLPVLLFYSLSPAWMVLSEIPVSGLFKWKKPGPFFYIGLAAGVTYVIVTFVQVRYRLKGPEYWPPLALLSLFNSFGEEVFYRGALYGLLERTVKRKPAVVFFQAVLYGLIHIPLGNSEVAVLAFFFGLLLGIVRYRENSITPCVIVHFIVDLSAIGQSFLQFYGIP